MTGLFGRKNELQRIAELHAKPVPDHITVVGPRSIGKSTLLRAVHSTHAAGSRSFAGAALVDLRHDPPEKMEDVLARIAASIKTVLVGTAHFKGVGQYIQPSDTMTELNDQLSVAIGEVADAGQRLLLILDGCDPVLQNSAIPRNLWDNLRALAQSNGLRLMTGTRRPLHELCYNPDSRTSDFFRIFNDQPIDLGPFDDADWVDVCSKTQETLDGSAQKELRNWTGGHPDLVEQLLERLGATKKARCSKAEVDAAAASMVDNSARVEAIWRECPEESRRDLVGLLRGDVSLGEVPENRWRYLVARGLAVRSGGKLKLANRLIERKVTSRKGDVSGIREIFGTREAFEANVPKLLELRLSTVVGADAELARIVLRSIRHLPDDPGACLSGARDIVDRALYLIWAIEAPNMRMQKTWLDSWRQQASNAATKALDRATREPEIPDERGAQCDILRMITGRQGLRPVATKLSKPSYVLVEHMKQLGDLKNHSQPRAGDHLAVTFALAAIELCESLARDFRGA